MKKNKYTYLFEAYDNGYGNCDRTYFESYEEITQELADEFINKVNISANRTGSSFKDLKKGADQSGYIIEELKGQHKVDGILKNIIGNY